MVQVLGQLPAGSALASKIHLKHVLAEPLQVDVACHHCGRPVTPGTIHAEFAGTGPGNASATTAPGR